MMMQKKSDEPHSSLSVSEKKRQKEVPMAGLTGSTTHVPIMYKGKRKFPCRDLAAAERQRGRQKSKFPCRDLNPGRPGESRLS